MPITKRLLKQTELKALTDSLLNPCIALLCELAPNRVCKRHFRQSLVTQHTEKDDHDVHARMQMLALLWLGCAQPR